MGSSWIAARRDPHVAVVNVAASPSAFVAVGCVHPRQTQPTVALVRMWRFVGLGSDVSQGMIAQDDHDTLMDNFLYLTRERVSMGRRVSASWIVCTETERPFAFEKQLFFGICKGRERRVPLPSRRDILNSWYSDLPLTRLFRTRCFAVVCSVLWSFLGCADSSRVVSFLSAPTGKHLWRSPFARVKLWWWNSSFNGVLP